MDLYLKNVGYWNLIGSLLMFLFFSRALGNRILVNWSQIFRERYELNYYSKLWLLWAIGLNLFFAIINILAAWWSFEELKLFLIRADVIIYLIFIGLTVRGLVIKQLGAGAYVALIIFAAWSFWGIATLYL